MILPLLLGIAVVISAAKAGGWLSNRLGQPAVLGELVIGLLLGPSVLNLFGQPYFEAAHTTETLYELGELGVIFLMFAAGLEIHLADIQKIGKPALLVGVWGVILPVLFGALVTFPFGYTINQAIFVGIVLSATSVSISAQTLIELGRLRSREGLTLLGAAVVDDVLAIIALSLFTALALGEGGGVWGLLWIIARMALFLIGSLFLGIWLLPRLVLLVARLPISEGLISFVVVVTLGFAWASESWGGIAAITGAFIAGIGLSQSKLKNEIERGIRTLTYALFVPIFLVTIGLTANVRQLSGADIGLAVVICLVAIFSKWIGAALGAHWAKMSWKESWRVGAGMISRGEVGLIIAGVGIQSGVIQADVFTVVVVMILVTTLSAPPLLRWTFRQALN